MATLWQRICAALGLGGGIERQPTEPEVEADPHQVTGRPTGGGAPGDPGTTGTGPNDGFVGRVSGEDAGVSGGPETPDGAEKRAGRDD